MKKRPLGDSEMDEVQGGRTEGEGSVHKYMTEPELVEGNAAIHHLRRPLDPPPGVTINTNNQCT